MDADVGDGTSPAVVAAYAEARDVYTVAVVAAAAVAQPHTLHQTVPFSLRLLLHLLLLLLILAVAVSAVVAVTVAVAATVTVTAAASANPVLVVELPVVLVQVPLLSGA